MPDQAGPQHHAQQALIDAVDQVRVSIEALDARMTGMAVTVQGLVTWQREQAEEDRIRRDREQKESYFAEWTVAQEGKQRARVERWKRAGRAAGALIAGADAIGIWEVISTSEHGMHWSMQLGGAIVLGVVSLILLIL